MNTQMVLSRPPAATAHGGVRVRRATSSVVGRSTEVAAIEAAVDEAQSGIAGVSLEGEPGIGKSRLMREAAQYARLRGLCTLATNCYEIERAMQICRGIPVIAVVVGAYAACEFGFCGFR